MLHDPPRVRYRRNFTFERDPTSLRQNVNLTFIATKGIPPQHRVAVDRTEYEETDAVIGRRFRCRVIFLITHVRSGFFVTQNSFPKRAPLSGQPEVHATRPV